MVLRFLLRDDILRTKQCLLSLAGTVHATGQRKLHPGLPYTHLRPLLYYLFLVPARVVHAKHHPRRVLHHLRTRSAKGDDIARLARREEDGCVEHGAPSESGEEMFGGWRRGVQYGENVQTEVRCDMSMLRERDAHLPELQACAVFRELSRCVVR